MAENLIFNPSSSGGTWGSITGTLSAQLDLQAALDAKFTLPSLTAGSALFSNGTTIAQDNQGYHYNDTENRLSVFTTLGNEVVTNGTFTGNASGWTVPSGMAYSSNSVSKTGNGTGALTQSITIYPLREHLLTYTISNWTVGTVTPSFGGITGTAVGANGTYTERFVVTASTQLAFTPTNTARFTIDTVSIKPLTGSNTKANINTGGLSVEGSWSNGSPNTTRAMTFNNDGSYTWTDYRFAGVLRGSFGFNSSGGMDMYASGGNYFGFYGGNSGLTSNSLFAYLYPTAFVHYGSGFFNTGVMAGATYAPTSTLQTVGGLALQVKRITASQTLDNTATHWICDATNAAACAGTPSAACSSWNNQTDCEKWDAHGGCTWFAGNSCSTFNNESGMGSCAGQAGCSVDTYSCSGPSNQGSCEAQDDSYGGACVWNNCTGQSDQVSCEGVSGCTWNYSSCSGYDNQYANCTGQTGCAWNGNDCSAYDDNYGSCTGDGGCSWSGGGYDCSASDGTDQSTCEANPGCVWDGGLNECRGTCSGTQLGNGACSGQYNTSCTGDNCSGTYNTGNCSGTYGAACQGTSTCVGIDDSTNCGLETGCTWSSVLNATLPSMASYPHRTYWVKNQAAVASTVLVPQAGETVNGASSYTIRNTDSVHIAPYHDLRNCSEFVSAGTCTPNGCTINYSACSYDTMSNFCTGNAVCPAHDGNQSACEAQQYFSSCAGQYTVTKDWHVWSDLRLLGISLPYVAKTANYTLTTSDYTVNCTSGTFTLTLPTAVGVTGQLYNLKNSGTGIITVNTTSSQTIDGNASGALTLNQYDNLAVQSNGANWIII